MIDSAIFNGDSNGDVPVTEEHIKSAIQSFEHTKKPVKVHIKIDTGMNRIGLNYKEAPEFINKILILKLTLKF